MARILVVEDSDSFAEYVRATLMPSHDVDVARNGREACRLTQCNRYDLIITDIFMPDVDGFETLRLIRQAWPDVPVIAMTGVEGATRDFLTIASQLGAAETIRKPFRPAELGRLVAAALARPAP